jgi:hypothetical protein
MSRMLDAALELAERGSIGRYAMTDRISGYDPETGICWRFFNKGDEHSLYCKCPAHSKRYGERTLAWFGRCRSGSRWFWAAGAFFDDAVSVFGWENTEELATTTAMAAVQDLRRNNLPMIASFVQRNASDTLKQLNEEKRRARPAPDTSETRLVEYLYAHGRCYSDGPCGCEKLTGTARWNYHLKKFQITKKTKQRIYYSRKPLPFEEREDRGIRDLNDYGVAFINRQEIEREGEIWSHKSGGWWEADCCLYLRLPTPKVKTEELPNLGKLKAAMAAAHPDRGGSSAAFIAARVAYTEARRRLRGNHA